MTTYNNSAILSAKTLLQQGTDSWESLPKYEVDRKPAYASSTFSSNPTIEIAPSSLEKLKSRLISAKEARDRRASLYEVWQQKLPTVYAKQTHPTAESYPPHRAEFAHQQRHQSWYPHYQPSGIDSDAKPDASKVEELKRETCHQSWYPHYKGSDNISCAEPDIDIVEDLKKETRHQSWYPHYKISSDAEHISGAAPDASETEDLTERTQHQSWYPHYKSSGASSNDSVDTLIVEDLKKERTHQSWYPHYTIKDSDITATPDSSKVHDLKKHARHQSWYPHFKTSSGANVAASKVVGLKDRVVFRLSRITDLGIDEGMRAAYPKYAEIEC